MIVRKRLSGILGIIVGAGMGAVALAQEPQTQTAPRQDETLHQERMERRERRRELRKRRLESDGHRGTGRLTRSLNLTEEQRRQRRDIIRRRLESTKSQRQELLKLREKRIAGTLTTEDEARAKILRQEIRAAFEGVRTEMDALLTTEQKAKLEQLKQERKMRREQRMKEREERLNNKSR